ncbi:MAG: hypothetical protein GY750_10360 [Lentisphaerae bacterium]|nr:hypothetical protein [Lentisphaerota bacterium]MCP4101813.1 hypothetical protein [Lentisphaerota bacterium]
MNRTLKLYSRRSSGEAEKAIEVINASLFKVKEGVAEREKAAKTIIAIRAKNAVEKKRLDKLQKEVRSALRQAKSISAKSISAKYKILFAFSSLPTGKRTISKFNSIIKENGKRLGRQDKKIIVRIAALLINNYQPQKILIKYFGLLKDKQLPWSINGYQYKIIENTPRYFKIKTKYSEGAYGIKKISWSRITDEHLLMLWDWYIIASKGELTESEIQNASRWLFTEKHYKMLKEFADKYCSKKDKAFWDSILTETADSGVESSALLCAVNIFNAFRAGKNDRLVSLSGQWCREFTETKTYARFNKVIDKIIARGKISSPLVAVSNALSKDLKPIQIWDIATRFQRLKCVDSVSKEALRKKFMLAMNQMKGNREYTGTFGVFNYVPAGGIYGWSAPGDSQQMYSAPLLYIPAMMDIGAWANVAVVILRRPNSLGINAHFDQELRQWHPYFLYSAGWAAWQLDSEGVLKMSLDRLEKILRTGGGFDKSAYALAANLAMKKENPERAIKILKLYKPSRKEHDFLLPLFYLKALIAQNKMSEKQISGYNGKLIRQHGNSKLLEKDIKLLGILKSIVSGKKVNIRSITASLLEGSSYPRLWGELLTEAAARDLLLRRDSLSSVDFIKVLKKISKGSVFYADLNRQILLYELGSQELYPGRVLRILETSITDYRPSMMPLYPDMVLLRSAFYSLNSNAKSIAHILKSYSNYCPLFSNFEMQASVLAKSSPEKALALFKNLERRRPPSGTLLNLGILTALVHSDSKCSQQVLNVLKKHETQMSWTEKLILKRFETLLKAL